MFLEETKVVTCGDGLCFLLDFGSHVLCPFLLGFWDQPDAAVQSKLCILTYFRSTTTRKCALSETWFAHCQQCVLRKYRSVLSLFLYIFLAIFSSCSWRKKKKRDQTGLLNQHSWAAFLTERRVCFILTLRRALLFQICTSSPCLSVPGSCRPLDVETC